MPTGEAKSMIERRQVVGSPEFPALLLSPAVMSACSIAAGFAPGETGDVLATGLGLILISAVTSVMWRYRRRVYASPRRNGRRI
jgi:hypothetical protein